MTTNVTRFFICHSLLAISKLQKIIHYQLSTIHYQLINSHHRRRRRRHGGGESEACNHPLHHRRH